MYIIYWDQVMNHRYSLRVFDNPTHTEFVGSDLAPSECQWIVPGTIDPRDD